MFGGSVFVCVFFNLPKFEMEGNFLTYITKMLREFEYEIISLQIMLDTISVGLV